MPSTDTKITEIFIPGPAGRLEAKYFKSKKNTSPIALVLHPHEDEELKLLVMYFFYF